MLDSKEANHVLQDFIKSLIPVVDKTTHESLLTMVDTYIKKKNESDGWSALEAMQKKAVEFEKFDLEAEYKSYLLKVKLYEETMTPNQAVEIKRAFMGGCGSTLILTGMLGQLHEEEAYAAINSMLTQVNEFWQSQE